MSDTRLSTLLMPLMGREGSRRRCRRGPGADDAAARSGGTVPGTSRKARSVTLTLERASVERRLPGPASCVIAHRGAAALAAGNGVGRFVYTPILPLTHDQAGLSATSGANLASQLRRLPGRQLRTPAGPFPLGDACLDDRDGCFSGSDAAQRRTSPPGQGCGLIAGFTSALAFVYAVGALLSGLRRFGPAPGRLGIRGYRRGDRAGRSRGGDMAYGVVDRDRPHAAADRGLMEMVGTGAWVVVGLAAIPGSALWTALARRFSRPTRLAVALLLQAAGIALTGLARRSGCLRRHVRGHHLSGTGPR